MQNEYSTSEVLCLSLYVYLEQNFLRSNYRGMYVTLIFTFTIEFNFLEYQNNVVNKTIKLTNSILYSKKKKQCKVIKL